MDFNSKQQEIINSLKGAYLISAPVGTGKTTILGERVMTALNLGIKPEEILCLTFTNRAAEEMLEKVRNRIQKKEIYDQLAVKTFHGFCAYFIRTEAKAVGVSTDFSIFDKTEQVEIMKSILEGYPEYMRNDDNGNQVANQLLENIYNHRINEVEREIGCQVPYYNIDDSLKKIGKDYQQALEEQNALDFNELVLLTLSTIYKDEQVRKKWMRQYKFIQLDEFQDTHLSEYLIVKELAKESGNVAFIGDLDQTIYGWRGSKPFLIKGLVESHFPQVTEIYLDINYRFNNNILKAVKSFLESFEKPATKELESFNNGKEEGGDSRSLEVFEAFNFPEEVSWTVDTIKKLRQKEPESKIAVLCRANYLINQVADIFKQKDIEHITLDQFEFFRRQEIKDVYAYIKVLFNKFDLESAYRMVKRPPRNIGTQTLQNIRKEGGEIGIKISDFLSFHNYNFSEPFADLIANWQEGRIVVLDTETTGTDVLRDEIIQIYAIEVVNGQPGKEFHYYIKNTIPVGASAEVHGLTDEFLQENGREPQEVLRELKDFVADDITVGHNVNFDLSMITENSRRMGLDFSFADYYDTLDISRRMVESHNYKLTTLAALFNLSTATHDARDDVLATVDLLGILLQRLRKNAKERKELFAKHSKKFIKLSTQINKWQKAAGEKRPAQLLEQIWQESGLKEYYQGQQEAEVRQRSVQDLIQIFASKDDPDRPADIVLRELVAYGGLSKDINFLGLEKGKIPIVTVHQAKGLEFKYVFILGMNDGKFPFFRSELEEEKRLFYVALTRAKEKIFISYSKFNDYNYPMARSPFIDYIDGEYIKWLK
jgi:DNA helicase-2/ATP-dependent DNA helicase PcrA